MDTLRAEVKKLLAASEPPKPETPTTPGKLYRVQVGAYSVKANADAMLSENCTWGQRKRFSDGKACAPYSRFLDYDRAEGGGLVINEE
jgi:hypothetical protein